MSASAQARARSAPDAAVHEIAVPIAKLFRSPLNVRKQGGTDPAELAASILSHGVLQNLVVTPEVKKRRRTGRYAVVAGGRRLEALTQLAQGKRIPAQYPVRCIEVSEAQAIEISLAENTAREPLHPADECLAMQAMIDNGQEIAAVAAAFGMSTLRVQRRLKLANVAPRLLDLFRQNRVTLDQLMALAITDDHAQQLAVWEGASEWQRTPQRLRAALTQEEIDAATHPLGRFVGLAAYEAAGGTVRRDLFSEVDGAGYMTDVGLVERLALEKLRAVADGLAREGWAWTDVRTRLDYSDLSGYARAPMLRRAPTADEAAQIAALEARRDALQQEYERLEAAVASDGGAVDDARWREVDEALQQVEASLEALDAAREVADPAARGIAGVLVAVDSQGALDIRRGLIRPEDRKARAASCAAGSTTSDTEGSPQGEPSDKRGLSERLYRQLTAHRTAALQLTVAKRADVGVALLAWRLAAQVFYAEEAIGRDRTVQVRIEQSPLERDAPDLPASVARQQWEALRATWTQRLPARDRADTLLAWMLAADAVTLGELIAFCTACTLDDTSSGPDRQPRMVAAELARVTEVDMADWWRATHESFLGAVPKATILAAVGEALGAEAVNPLKALKRDTLVAEAERLLADTRWLPVPLR